MSWAIHVSLLSAPTVTTAIIGDFESFQFEVVLSEEGAGHVIVETGVVPEVLLADDTVWRFLEDGEPRGGFLLEAIEDLQVTEDETHRQKLSGRGLGAVLEWAAVYPRNFATVPVPVRVWTARSYPDVLRVFLTEAKARGTLAFLDITSWSSLVDSSAVSWGTTTDASIEAGDDLLSLTKRWAGLYPFDWVVTADFKLNAYNLKGTDRSATVVLHAGGSLKEQTKTRVRRNLKNVYCVETTQGTVTAYQDNVSIADWSRRETYIKPQEAVSVGPASMIALAALAVTKNEQVERLAVLDPGPGRRPFVDFDLGDRIGVADEGVITDYRCLAIAVAVDNQGNEQIETVLDTLLSDANSDLSNTGSGSGTGTTLLYTQNDADAIVATTTPQSVMPINVQATAITNARAGLVLPGVASVDMTLTAEILFENLVARSWKQVLSAGDATFGIPTLLLGIPEAESGKIWKIRLTTSVGTFTIPVGAGHWWLESSDLAGGAGGTDPNTSVNQSVVTDPTVVAPTSVTPTVALQTPVAQASNQAVSQSPTTATEIVMVAPVETVPVSGSDGWVSSIPSITTTDVQIQSGNSAGEIRGLFVRFEMTNDLVGRTVKKAELRLVPDLTQAVAPVLKIRADVSGTAAAPTTKVGFDTAVKTTAQIAWATTAVSAIELITPDLKTVVQEVITLNPLGPVTSLVFYVEDNGSPTSAYHVFRSFDHGTGPKPQLLVFL